MKATDVLAVYGALLSTAIFGWNILRARSTVRTRFIAGIGGKDGLQMGACISVQNPSVQAVHISNISLLYPHEKMSVKERIMHLFRYGRLPRSAGWVYSSLSNYGLNDGCPVSLDPGKSHQVFIPQDTIEKLLEGAVSRHIRAVVQDQLWRESYSNILEVEWRAP